MMIWGIGYKFRLGEDMIKGLKKVIHKLFHCSTFWHPKYWFKCPRCGKVYKCYWDGNDVAGFGTNFCNKCAAFLEDVKEKVQGGVEEERKVVV